MTSPTQITPLLLHFVKHRKEILDVGIGLGVNGYIIRTLRSPTYLAGVDIFHSNLLAARKHMVYDALVLCSASNLPFRRLAFDVIVATEIIEHLEKEDGAKLIEQCESMSKEIVILSTPNRAERTKGSITPLGYNPFESHRSSWKPGEFRRRGYKLYGTGALVSRLVGISFLKELVNMMFAYTFLLLPDLANNVFAIKQSTRDKT